MGNSLVVQQHLERDNGVTVIRIAHFPLSAAEATWIMKKYPLTDEELCKDAYNGMITVEHQGATINDTTRLSSLILKPKAPTPEEQKQKEHQSYYPDLATKNQKQEQELPWLIVNWHSKHFCLLLKNKLKRLMEEDGCAQPETKWKHKSCISHYHKNSVDELLLDQKGIVWFSAGFYVLAIFLYIACCNMEGGDRLFSTLVVPIMAFYSFISVSNSEMIRVSLQRLPREQQPSSAVKSE